MLCTGRENAEVTSVKRGKHVTDAKRGKHVTDYPVPSAEKYATGGPTGVKRRKTGKLVTGAKRGKYATVSNAEKKAGKQVTDAKRGKHVTGLPEPSAGKYATGGPTGVKRGKRGKLVTSAKRRKTCSWFKTRENMQPVQSTGCDRVPSPVKQGNLRTEENIKPIYPFSTVVVVQ